MGFDKASDDLIIKISKHLVEPQTFGWHTKQNKASELKLIHKSFHTAQKDLASLNIDEYDVMTLTHQNKILACISSCKSKHSGPETTEEELNALVQKLKDDQKSLCTSLNKNPTTKT